MSSQCQTCGSTAPHIHNLPHTIRYGDVVRLCRDGFHQKADGQTVWMTRRFPQSPRLGFDARDDWEAERHLAEQAMERD